jgi:hypothetical protein
VVQRPVDRLAGAGVPDATGPLIGGGDDPLALGIEGGGPDCPMWQRLADGLAGAGVPDASGPVVGNREDAPARGIEAGPDRAAVL